MAAEKFGDIAFREALKLSAKEFRYWLQTKGPHGFYNQLDQIADIAEKTGLIGGDTSSFQDRTKQIYPFIGEVVKFFGGQEAISIWLAKYFGVEPFGKLPRILAAIKKDLQLKPSESKTVIDTKFYTPSALAEWADNFSQNIRRMTQPEMQYAFLTEIFPIAPDIVKQPDINGDTPLHHSAATGDCFKLYTLLASNIDVRVKKNKQGQNVADLWPASAIVPIQSDDLGLELRRLSAAEATPNFEDAQPFWNTLIFIYSHNKALINQPDPRSGNTPLHLAMQAGEIFRINALLICGADPTLENIEGQTPAKLYLLNKTFLTRLERDEPQLSYREYAQQLAPYEAALSPVVEKLDRMNLSSNILNFELHVMANLFLLFKKQEAYLPTAKTWNVIDLAAGGVESFLPLLLLCQSKGIQLNYWAIDNSSIIVERFKRRYQNYQQFKYLRADASNCQEVLEALKSADAQFDGAEIVLLRQPDSLGLAAPERARSFHKMTTETIPFVARTNALVLTSFFKEFEAKATINSIATTALGTYQTVVPVAVAKPTMQAFDLRGTIQPETDAVIAFWHVKGRAFDGAFHIDDPQVLGKELRNLCVNSVSFDGFVNGMSALTRKYSWLINQPGPTTGNTALHCAAERGNISKVQFLLLQDANPLLLNKSGKKPLDVALQNHPQAQALHAILAAAEARFTSVPSTRVISPTPLETAIEKAKELLSTLELANAAPTARTSASSIEISAQKAREIATILESVTARSVSSTSTTAATAQTDMFKRQKGKETKSTPAAPAIPNWKPVQPIGRHK